jgi:asparagine synthase (glutamine-hydrolysing)
MSAIAGIYHLNNEPINLEHGRQIMKELEKYPANDVQTWHSEKVFLGCHAQWITPESVGERLPFYDHKRQLVITADAIIDNRDELFERLQVHKGDRKKITDSQLILLAYHKWGEESPKFLVGDFAFMIWDEKKQQLFGSRDLSGYRTLYYYRDQSRFVFCTTIEPILSLPYIKKQLNEQWLAEYLAISGMIDTVDALTTPYKNIEQVPPAHSVLIGKDKIKLTRYGTFSSGEQLRFKTNEEYEEAFQEVFQKAVSARLRTHHKVGAQLSGGLDSGSVVAFAAKAMRRENQTLHTFSYIPPSDFVDFTQKRYMADERPFIKKTVQYVGGIKDHYLDFEGKNSYSEIDDMLEIMEMPYKFFENSFWLKGMFEGASEKDIGILLNGDRGNWTISWGTALDYYAILLKRLKWLRLFKELDQYCRNVGGPRLGRLPFIARIGFPILNQIFPQDTSFEMPMIINQGFAERTGVFRKLKEHGIGETGWLSSANMYEERRGLFEKMFPWNAGNTLTSKLSLRHSLWKRDPTNDIRVVRFCLSIPDDQFVQNGLDRALIRRSTENYLPDEVRLNQRLQGVQGVDWLHRMIPYWDTFINELQQFSIDKNALEFFNEHVINKALLKVKQGVSIENVYDPDYKILMRSLIVYRFIKKFA